jgi:hypothetical protein
MMGGLPKASRDRPVRELGHRLAVMRFETESTCGPTRHLNDRGGTRSVSTAHGYIRTLGSDRDQLLTKPVPGYGARERE